MPSFEYAFIRLVLNMLDQWPQLRRELSRCASSEEAGRMVATFLQQQDIPEKQMLLKQTLALALTKIEPSLLGTEVGIACRLLFEPGEYSHLENTDELNNWRGNSSCALLVRLLAETHEPHGGVAWSYDLARRGYPTVADWRGIEMLQAAKDYERATLSNTTLEQIANFCDFIQAREYASAARPHRALAGLLFPRLGRTTTHAVLFRIAQSGLLDHLSPALYPLADTEAEQQLAHQARVCDARASQLLGIPSSWHRYAISHLALAGLLANVVGVELAASCMAAIDEQGTLVSLEPRLVGLPDGGEENEWQWHCRGRLSGDSQEE